jgi:16S rRNA (adenine1518-N6/adenine1519-N6)-dimethyltransferase
MKRNSAGGPRPRKSLGQHFLRDTGILADIARAVTQPPGGVVLEIGAGTGQLTDALLAAGHTVIAVEVERRLVEHLHRRFADVDRLQLVEADARDLDLSTVIPPGTPFAVAGNLPYFAANLIVRRLLEGTPKPTELVVMVQREVAREFAAKPGHLSLLAVSIQVYTEPTILFDVAPEAFDPPPAVHSSVVRLTLRPSPLVSAERLPAFFAFVSRTFRNPRKQIHNALGMEGDAGLGALAAAGIDPARRPETLSIAEWVALMDACTGALAHA